MLKLSPAQGTYTPMENHSTLSVDLEQLSLNAMASISVESTCCRAALAVVDAYNSWTLNEIMSYRAPNCIHQILPSSFSRPSMNNADYSSFLTSTMLPHFRHMQVTVHDLVEDTAANKVVLWISSAAETDVGPYANEYFILLCFNSEGKVEKFVEFLDSVTSVAFYQRLRELMVERGQHAGNNKARSKL